MKRRLTPREKKALAYERDTASPSQHGYRKHWPRIKAIHSRRYRRRSTAYIDKVQQTVDGEYALPSPPPRRWEWWGRPDYHGITLDEWLAERRRRRVAIADD
jgi:hypothetical protein